MVDRQKQLGQTSSMLKANAKFGWDLDEMTQEDRDFLEETARQIILHGERPRFDAEWYQTWFRVNGLDERQGLLMMATVLPQRMLLAVLDFDMTQRIREDD